MGADGMGGYNAAMRLRARNRGVRDARKTEQRLAASKNLDRMSTLEIVRLMNREDRQVAVAVGRETQAIARAVDEIVRAIRNGGRLIYVGAGSSGRIAVLDATEIPPTFGVPASQVIALLAGGSRAMTGAVEGAEDSASNGEKDLRAKRVSKKDVVVGIAASGTTPYVLGATKYARRMGATTVAITSNGKMALARKAKIAIAVETGAEVLTGSTRLKAGTAQKMVLNMLTTAAMVRLGHVYENLMIDVVPTNEKLSERSAQMLAEASEAKVSEARHALRQAGHNLRVAMVMLKREVRVREAMDYLKRAGGNLRKALGE
jgi:N-acetylmuramic acid 6-phosphate etherase